MKVLVKPLKGDTLEVEHAPEILVKELKDKIAAINPSMPADLQKLIYSGKILDDARAVQEYGIKDGGTIVVMVSKAKPPAVAPPAATAPTITPVPESAATAVTPADAEQITTHDAAFDATVEQLMQMGFQRSQVERCLEAAFGSPDRAVEYLMSGIPELDGDDDSDGAPSDGEYPEGGHLSEEDGEDEGSEPLPPALAALRSNPMFTQVATMAQQNPMVLQQMLPALAESHPELLQAIEENPDAFQRMLADAANGVHHDDDSPGVETGPAGMNAEAMAAMMHQDPAMMQQMMENLSESDPELAAQIQGNPQALASFMQAAMEDAEMEEGAGGGPGEGDGPLSLTEEEGRAVQRLVELGFAFQIAAQAYVACGKNEDHAANYLFDHGMDPDF